MGEKLDYSEVRPENKWKILLTQWRFVLWAIYTSIGSMTGGFDLIVGGQFLALVLQQLFPLTEACFPKAIRYPISNAARRLPYSAYLAERVDRSNIWRFRLWGRGRGLFDELYRSEEFDLRRKHHQRYWDWHATS
jgi:hypothetical protein